MGKKIAFSKLNAKISTETKIAKIASCDIEVKQYLPIEDKNTLVAAISSHVYLHNQQYHDCGYEEIIKVIGIIGSYTNLNFTETMLKDLGKLYDLLVSTGIKDSIYQLIPESELEMVEFFLNKTINAIYSYHQSFAGVMDLVDATSSNLSQLSEFIQNPNLELVKEILEKMG